MAEVRKLLVAVLVVVVSLSWPAVSAQTHHVVGGDGGWTFSSGRVFRVGDKISFTYPATDETIVELQSLEDFTSCNLVNPIRMYTDTDRHITLEKEGIRYFTSANPENCKNGLKLPVYVQPTPFDAGHSFDHPFELPPPFWPPFEPEPEHGPPDEPPPQHGPPPFEPWPKPFPDLPPPHVPDTPPPHVPHSPPPPPPVPHSPPPYVPHSPPPPPPVPHLPPPYVPHSPPPPPPVPHSPPPHVPHSPPPPAHVPHSPPPPVAPSGSTHLNVFSFVLFAALALSFMGQL